MESCNLNSGGSTHTAFLISSTAYREFSEEKHAQYAVLPLYDIRHLTNYFKDMRYNVLCFEEISTNEELIGVFESHRHLFAKGS